jgi:hypothetical protein
MELITSILNSVDGFAALGVALWLLAAGLKRFDTFQVQYQHFVESILASQQSSNKELMSLVAGLCRPQEDPEKKTATTLANIETILKSLTTNKTTLARELVHPGD